MLTGWSVCQSVSLSVCQSVGQSVCWSAGLLAGKTLLFNVFLQYRSCPNAWLAFFYHCPCPPARDFGSRVYGLVFFNFDVALNVDVVVVFVVFVVVVIVIVVVVVVVVVVIVVVVVV